MNRFLNQSRQHASVLALPARHMGEVDVHLVHATVFHDGGNVGDDAFESL
jgi:hypothetical protein